MNYKKETNETAKGMNKELKETTMKFDKELNKTSDITSKIKEKPMSIPSHVFIREVPVGAVVNGISLDTTEGVARSDYQNACIGFEASSTPLSGDTSREGGSRMYFKVYRNRGDVKFLPVTNDSGDIIGFEAVGSGDDAVITLATAIIASGEILQKDMQASDNDDKTLDNPTGEDSETNESVREFLSGIQQNLFTGQSLRIRISDCDDYEHLSFALRKDTDLNKFNNVFDQDILDANISKVYEHHDEDGYAIFITADIEL